VPGVTARYAHVPDSALIAAADRVSARIVSALDRGAKIVQPTEQPGQRIVATTRD